MNVIRAQLAGRRGDGAAGDGVRRAGISASLAVAAIVSSSALSEQTPDQDEVLGDHGRSRHSSAMAGSTRPYSSEFVSIGMDGVAPGIAGRWVIARAAVAGCCRVVPTEARTCTGNWSAPARGLNSPRQGTPRVTPRPETLARASALLSESGADSGAQLVGMAPGAAYGHAKRWPPLRVAEVIGRLTLERGATCVLVGASGDRDAGREIESALPSGARAVNLIGRTDLRLIGVLSRCTAFVSNDSGAMPCRPQASR
jgi:hypothetical protein